MNLKSKIGDLISNVIYKLLIKNSLNYHVSLKNIQRSKPKNIDIFDFSLFSFYNNRFPEISLYEDALRATDLQQEDNLSKRLRHYVLFQLLENTLQQHKDGNVVECGCFKGQSAYGLASVLKKNNFKNRFLIFDSFEGLSDLAEEDKNEVRTLLPGEEHEQQKQFAASLELVQKNLKEFDFIDYYKGWIPERFNEVKNEKFSFVHIDVDLYHPIKDSLEFFYPKLLQGGVICLDDYGMSQFPGAKKATDEFIEKNKPSFFMWFPFGGAVLQK